MRQNLCLNQGNGAFHLQSSKNNIHWQLINKLNVDHKTMNVDMCSYFNTKPYFKLKKLTYQVYFFLIIGMCMCMVDIFNSNGEY